VLNFPAASKCGGIERLAVLRAVPCLSVVDKEVADEELQVFDGFWSGSDSGDDQRIGSAAVGRG
jgi:hypothetical protein